MKVALLAGGRGTRLSEETLVRPKPMVEIGGQPILWHIMQHFAAQQYGDFTVALGYLGQSITRWASEQGLLGSSARTASPSTKSPITSLQVVETGLDTNTGGRIKRLAPIIGQDPFVLAWGDGVCDVEMESMLAFHRKHGKVATVMIVRPPARFGHVNLDGDRVTAFAEKPRYAEGWINGGVFILEPQVFDYISGDTTAFEKEPMENLARDGQLMAYRHTGFWQCMDTLRDKRLLEDMWQTGAAPWKTW